MELDATHATLLLLLLLSSHASGQPTTPAATATTTDPQQEDVAVSFRPSIAIVIGIFSIMFSLTFLLIMYAKFCHTAAAGLYGHDPDTLLPNSLLATATSRFSGMDKSVIESLPFFRFSSLKGSKEGLECAVCLSRFEDAEVLRLLPKCKHAFHIDCVDRWLEGHSSCPLCRHRVEVEDVTLFKYSSSSRFLFRNQSTAAGGDLDLELYVEREVDGGERGNGSSLSSSSRFTLGGSFRMKGRTSTKEQSLLPERGGGRGDDGEEKFLHKFKHRIIVSDVVFKNRWSDLNSADLTSLNSEMLNLVSSQRFSDRFGPAMVARAEAAAAVDMESGGSTSTISRIKEEMERKRLLDSKAGQMKAAISGNSESSTTPTSRPPDPSPPPNPLITSGKRSVSEITNVSRFVDGRVRGARDHSAIVIGGREEKVRRVWLPIARKTVQWFEGRDRRPPQPQLGVPDV